MAGVDVYEGIRILDFTQLEQGPSGTQVLADFGAEVIKVERVDVGEIGRSGRMRMPTGWTPHWAANNRNKKSLSLDLKNPQAMNLVRSLVRQVDIVASNFRPGVMERLGLGHEELRQINPRIISAYASGYGRTGPYRARRGQDLAAQAIGGVMAMSGTPDRPSPVGTYAIDYLAAMHFAQGMMLALAARERTGCGQVVDTSLLNSAVALHLQEGTEYLNDGVVPHRAPLGIAHPGASALYGQYRAADGKWLVLIAEYFIDQPWDRVCAALELDESIRLDDRFTDDAARASNTEACQRAIQDGIEKFDREEAIARFEAEDVLVAPVLEYDELFVDPQVVHNGMVLEYHHERAGLMRMVGMPVRLSATPGRPRLPPPTVGEHNEQLLTELGLTEAQIAALQAEGAVGAENVRRLSGQGDSW
ncbi:CoA transferase [Microbacterium sp. X-17]|uniref:CaiB/BaiF CoA transferase family protein n=1 Tax=Microbacterium sp. X-17 TaxID=3144404 RepID=UPI0031F4AE1D